MNSILLENIAAYTSEMRSIRRDIHAHPELGYEVHRTAALVAERLESWGFEVSKGIGKTGVVGTMQAGDTSKTVTRAIGLRADMDALPIHEANSFAHVSLLPGKMHACGHDGHTAMLLGAARYLAEHRSFNGTVHLIFQPAEESGGGAKAMIEDGLFNRFPVDVVYGIHNWPGLAEGKIGIRSGSLMASASNFGIRIFGDGAHAAMPHLGKDPVFVAVQLASAIQGIVTRGIDPLDGAVISITKLEGGDAFNVIPDSAFLGGTVRALRRHTLDVIEQKMAKLCDHLTAGFDCRFELDFRRNVPATVNDASAASFASDIAEETFGDSVVIRDFSPTMTSEDFSWMLEQAPGAFMFLGNGDGAHRDGSPSTRPCTLHNPHYDFNDALLPIGAALYVSLVNKFLSQ